MINLRQYVLFTILLIFSFAAKSQDSTKQKQSKFEEFSSEDGILKKLESHKIGKIKGFIMYKKTTTNVETGKFYNAVEISEKGGFWSPKFGSIILDEDEIPSLIKVLKYFSANVITDECKEECPSYFYETKSGVNIICNKTIGAYANAWHIYLSRSYNYLTAGSIDLENKELTNLITLLESYK